MKVLKVLRKMLECETSNCFSYETTVLDLSEDEEKWYKAGFREATTRFEVLIDLLEEDE